MGIVLILIILNLVSLVSALTINSVSTTPSEIEPGETAEIAISLKNNLDSDITDITISLDLSQTSFAPVESSSEYSFDELREGKEKEIRFKISSLSDIESGTYKIPVTLKYTYNAEKITKTSYIGLVVNSPIILTLDYSGNLIKGMNNKLNLRLTNSGLSKVKLLSLEVQDSLGIQILNSRSAYIGDIASDDFDNVEFEIFVSNSAGKQVELPVILNYRDALNNKIEKIENVKLTIYTKEEAIQLGLIQKNNTLTYVIVIVILIILYLIYRSWKKARKRKLNSQG